MTYTAVLFDAHGLSQAESVATAIRVWNKNNINDLRDMLRELRGYEDGMELIDMAELPTADIPADVDTSFPVWAIDASGKMLVGEDADQIMSIEEYRTLAALK